MHTTESRWHVAAKVTRCSPSIRLLARPRTKTRTLKTVGCGARPLSLTESIKNLFHGIGLYRNRVHLYAQNAAARRAAILESAPRMAGARNRLNVNLERIHDKYGLVALRTSPHVSLLTLANRLNLDISKAMRETIRPWLRIPNSPKNAKAQIVLQR